MPTLLLTFPARRYHATPFGHHVNEGVIEWPPSPWRLLRALLAVGYATQGWEAVFSEPVRSVPPPVAASLIEKLAGVLPTYTLPPAIGAHTRHYMPVARLDGDREGTTLVFDTWAQIEKGELAVTWQVALDAAESELLGRLVGALGYLGRSESWVTARLATVDPDPGAANCFPCADVPAPGPGWEQVAVMAAEPAAGYRDWRIAKVDALLTGLPPIALPVKAKGPPTARERKPTEARDAERHRAVAPYPADLIACLHADTTWLREHGWSQPPGSRRVLYWRRADALQAPAGTGAADSAADAVLRVPFVLLSLTSPTRNNHALPPLARALPQGEMLHRQMVGARLRIAPNSSPRMLSGCDAEGQPLRGAHRHSHVLSLDLDGDHHIDHLLVWAPDGLDALDRWALRSTRGTYTKGGVGDLRLIVAATGDHDDLQRLPMPYREALARVTGTATEWISATAFVAPRHLKVKGAHTAEGQLIAELTARGFPVPRLVQWLDPQRNEQAQRLRHHLRVRRHGGVPPPADIGMAWRLSFDEPVTGPICLGYGSHFGLGRFEALDDEAVQDSSPG